jgi:uncharacterized protein (TIGR03086 family)
VQTVADLEQACANTERLVRGVGSEEWSLPTPCADWDVRALVNHSAWVLNMMGVVTRGDAIPARDLDVLGSDPERAYAEAAARAITGWKERGTSGTVTIPFGTIPADTALSIAVVDTFVHGWDIARATNQDPRLDPGLGAALLEWVPAILPPARQNRAFGPIVTVSEDAPAPERLLALLGRCP